MKRFIALVLSLVMALSLCVPTWGAESVATFDQLKDAITAGKTDIEVTGQIVLTENLPLTNVTINTGTVEDAFVVPAGYTLTLGAGVTINAAESILYANGGTIDIDGATLVSTHTSHALGFVDAGGTINMNSGSVTAYWTGLTASGAGSAVNILGGTVESTNSNATLAKNSGTTTVTGGTIKTHGDFVALWAKDSGVLNVNGGAAISPANGAAISVEGATATVSAGNFSGPVKANATGSISVSGGTFATDVSEFAGSEAVAEMTDGNTVTYIVGQTDILDAIRTAAYDVSFKIKQGIVAVDNNTILDGQSNPYVPNPAPTTYTVTFDANGGTGTMATATDLTAGTEYTLPACGFTAPADKEFDAWSVGGVNKAVGEKITITGNVEVTALWKDKAPAGGDNDNGGDEGGNTGTITPPSNWWPIGGIATGDKPIESPKTFDAGVALYVGMSVAAAVGTVTLSKKRED